MLPNSFYKANLTLLPKLDKYNTQKSTLQPNISDEYRCKNPQQHIIKPNSTISKKDHTPWSNGIYFRHARMVQYPQINQCDIPH